MEDCNLGAYELESELASFQSEANARTSVTFRPAIPADIERAILIESGHRCAVCGDACPLERAHIIPWHKSREHKAVDLICLCASCHERADLEKWGEKTLREYKKNPWVMRQRSRMESHIQQGAMPQLVRWAPNRGGEVGVDILTDPPEFIPWNLIREEVIQALLPQVRNIDLGFTVSLLQFRGRSNWIMAVFDANKREVANIWFGTDPTNQWAHDGLVRIGPVEESIARVWQTFQRYSDGTYRRIRVDSE